jgi:3-phosphoshikimate 1-carboxyvinyltransferase
MFRVYSLTVICGAQYSLNYYLWKMKYVISGPSSKHRNKPYISLPASKSISNRMLIIQCSLEPEPRLLLHNLSSDSDDTTVLMQKALASRRPGLKDVGHAGTAMRFLTAFYAVHPATQTFSSPDLQRMQERPVGPLVDALKTGWGPAFNYLGESAGYPPS